MAPQYNVNDIVFAADCGKLHEAKIMKIQSLDEHNETHKYFIHYQGWHRKYDTWIDDHLLAPMNDKKKVDKLRDKAEEMWNPSAKREEKALKDNGKKKTKLHFGGNKVILVDNNDSDVEGKTDSKDKKKRGKRSDEEVDATESAPVPSSPDNSSRRGKRKGKGDEQTTDESCSVISADTGVVSSNGGESGESSKKRRKALLMADLIDEDDSQFVAKIQIPFELKRHAVDEWNLITKDSNIQRLLLLPKKSHSNVRAIFRAFLELKKSDKNIEESLMNEYYQFMSIFLLQFDRALPTLLLFRQERQQYDKLCSLFPQVVTFPSIAYGAEHIIRFFLRLPKLLYGAVVASPDMENFLGKFNEFIKFVSKKSDQYLSMTMYVGVEEAMNTMIAEDTSVLQPPLGLIDVVNPATSSTANTNNGAKDDTKDGSKDGAKDVLKQRPKKAKKDD